MRNILLGVDGFQSVAVKEKSKASLRARKRTARYSKNIVAKLARTKGIILSKTDLKLSGRKW